MVLFTMGCFFWAQIQLQSPLPFQSLIATNSHLRKSILNLFFIQKETLTSVQSWLNTRRETCNRKAMHARQRDTRVRLQVKAVNIRLGMPPERNVWPVWQGWQHHPTLPHKATHKEMGLSLTYFRDFVRQSLYMDTAACACKVTCERQLVTE